MTKEQFEFYSKEYSPIIKNLIEKNREFYGFNQTIRWGFGLDENVSIIATCNRKTNIITVNLKSVIKAIMENDLRTIEYFLIHEIRHIFQNLIIEDYKDNKSVPIEIGIVKKWIFEGNNYVTALDNNGNENPKYFLQDSEMDAYAFSYALMKYKYAEVNLFVPSIYDRDFFDIVDEFINYFKAEGFKESVVL